MLVHRYEFPQDVVTLQHLLVTPAVDVRDPNSGCRNTFVYVADVLGFALLVYDVANRRSWRIQDKTFYPYPTYGTYTIAGLAVGNSKSQFNFKSSFTGESFELMDGILGLALSPYVPGQDRRLYYHAMSSPTENYVSTAYLRNQTIFEHDPAAAPYIFKVSALFFVLNTTKTGEVVRKYRIRMCVLFYDDLLKRHQNPQSKVWFIKPNLCL